MNTRIQVEHPITENDYEWDLVQQQIKIAAGRRVTIYSRDITSKDMRLECRLNAENLIWSFRPSPGKWRSYTNLLRYGRIESKHCIQDIKFHHLYDSMLTKLITHGKTRWGSRSDALLNL